MAGCTRAALAVVLLVMAASGQSEILEQDSAGFISAHELTIGASPDQVFKALDEVSEWWDPAHTYGGDASQLELGELGLCECLDRNCESVVCHMQFAARIQDRTVVLTGGLGPLLRLGATGTMSFDLEPVENGARLTYRYVVNGRGSGALAEPVDRVQLGQLERLKRYVETGSPEPSDGD